MDYMARPPVQALKTKCCGTQASAGTVNAWEGSETPSPGDVAHLGQPTFAEQRGQSLGCDFLPASSPTTGPRSRRSARRGGVIGSTWSQMATAGLRDTVTHLTGLLSFPDQPN